MQKEKQKATSQSVRACVRVFYPRGLRIIMGKCFDWIWIFYPPPPCSSTKRLQKQLSPHVLPREPRATCGRVLRCWRGEGGVKGGGRQLCSEPQPLTGFYETRPGGCQVIQTWDPFHPVPRLPPPHLPELLFFLLLPVGPPLLNPQ